MADIDLPLWSIPPNWRTPVTERLDWLTDVLGARDGSEQRRAIRLSPRRFFEFRINPVGPVRSYADQWFHRLGSEQCLLPLWHDKAKAADDALSGALRVEVATEYREFVEGGLAVLYAGPFRYEVVEIDTLDADGLDLVTELSSDWPIGTTIYPVRRAYMDPEAKFSAITSRVGEATMSFMLDTTNDYDASVGGWMIDGHPVISIPPNRLDNLEVQYARIMDEIDGRMGRIERVDIGGRAFGTQFYNWQATGLQAHHELRQMLYRLFGRQKAVWMPSFNEDVTLARPFAEAAVNLDVQAFGYTALGGVAPGRSRLYFKKGDDEYLVEIEDTAAALDPGEERLVLTDPSSFALDVGDTGSFADIVRLDQDSIEITHHTDTEGTCEVSAAFKAFSNTRVAPTVFLQPPFDPEKTDDLCGIDPPPPTYYWNVHATAISNSGWMNINCRADQYLKFSKPSSGADPNLSWDAYSYYTRDTDHPVPGAWSNNFQVWALGAGPGGNWGKIYDSYTSGLLDAPPGSNHYDGFKTDKSAFAALSNALVGDPLYLTGYEWYQLRHFRDAITSALNNRGGISLKIEVVNSI